MHKVIIVSFEYPPRRLTKTSDAIFQLVKFLKKRNAKIWIITFDDWKSGIEKNDTLLINRIPYQIPDNISDFSMVMNLKPAFQSAIGSILHEEDIDIIHLFEWQTLPFLIPWSKKLTPKIVYSMSSIEEIRDNVNNSNSTGIKKIEQLGISSADLIHLDSNNLLPYIDDMPRKEESLIKKISYNGTNFAKKIFENYKLLLQWN